MYQDSKKHPQMKWRNHQNHQVQFLFSSDWKTTAKSCSLVKPPNKNRLNEKLMVMVNNETSHLMISRKLKKSWPTFLPRMSIPSCPTIGLPKPEQPQPKVGSYHCFLCYQRKVDAQRKVGRPKQRKVGRPQQRKVVSW